MIGLYFSGTGNTKYCVERFTKQCSPSTQSFSIENLAALPQIQKHKAIVIGYPVQFSNIPKILQDYITTHADLWRGKKIFIIATMGLYSRMIRFSFLHSTYCPLIQYELCRNWKICRICQTVLDV